MPDPCVYFTSRPLRSACGARVRTDPTTREVELELPKWREGKFVAESLGRSHIALLFKVVKFLDTHKDQGNIDVGHLACFARGLWL